MSVAKVTEIIASSSKSFDDAVAFYSAAFGAKEHFRLTEPDGRVGHAEVHFGSTVVMMSADFRALRSGV